MKMKKMVTNIQKSSSKLLKNSKKFLKSNSSEILLGMGLGGYLSATIMGISATPKALDSIENKKVELQQDELTKTEIIKSAWKHYIPTALTFVGSTVLVMNSYKIKNQKIASIASAYTVSKNTLDEFRAKVVETIGEDKTRELEQTIARENKLPTTENKAIYALGDGECLIYDGYSGRYFRSTMNNIDRAINTVNRTIISDGYACLNDLYYEIGIDAIPMGNDVGWNVQRNLIDIVIDGMLTEDRKPCIMLKYIVEPEGNFDEHMYATHYTKSK